MYKYTLKKGRDSAEAYGRTRVWFTQQRLSIVAKDGIQLGVAIFWGVAGDSQKRK